MHHTEVESKYELSAADFEALKAIGRQCGQQDQVNVYYDSGWRLADSSATMRIRFERSGVPILTLKVPVSSADNRRVMKEFEAPLSRHCRSYLRSCHPTEINVDTELPEQVRDLLNALGVRHLERVGWVRNTRLVIEVDSLGQIELDRLELPDGNVVLEAEVESASAIVHEQLASLIYRHAPSAKPSTISKFQRFRRAAASALAGVGAS